MTVPRTAVIPIRNRTSNIYKKTQKMLPIFDSRAAKPHDEGETEQMLKTLETFPLPHERQKDMLIGVLFNGYVKFC